MVYFFVLASNWLLSLTRRRSLLVELMTFFLIVWLIATVPVDHSYDTAAYQETYGWLPSSSRFEKGYMWISYVCYEYGLTFVQFRMFLAGISYALFFLGLKLLTKNTSGFFSIYLLFPFMNDISNFRNTVMMGFVVAAFGIYFRLKNKLGITLALVLIYLGGQIQATAFFFLLGLIMVNLKASTIKKAMNIILPISYFIFLILWISPSNSLFAWILENISNLVGRADSSGIVNTFSNGDGKVKVIFIALFYLLIFTILQLQIKYRNININKKSFESIITYTFTIVSSSVFVIPMLASSFFFERIIRDVFIFFIIGFTAYFEGNTTRNTFRNKPDQQLRLIVGILFCVAAVTFLLPEKYVDFSPAGRAQYIPYMVKILN